ncbi:hypothetical protein D7Z54_09060 [Salibacterium salarium]|uniref:Uncharacterized protein n=1 Tax=Salibacterium salarium TaxID=284579 RepID=A0A3R9P6H0_9BACI|nr:hypothetical protein [Salibacterium salarium]RSL33828.1 hypothetical protein D7Z54_09060 [Salibacterium salarium]
MSGIIYLTLLWYLWLFQTFLASKDKFRLLTTIFILWLIITFPLEWSTETVIIRPSFLILCLAGFMLLATCKGRKKWRTFIIAAAFSFLFASMRMAEWYEPILFLFGHYFTYAFSFSFLLFIFSKHFIERLSIVIIASSAGEILYQVHLYPLTSTVYLGQDFILQYIILMISFIYGWNMLCVLLLHLQRLIPPRNINLPQ